MSCADIRSRDHQAELRLQEQYAVLKRARLAVLFISFRADEVRFVHILSLRDSLRILLA